MEGFEDQLGIRHETLEQLVLDGYPRGFGGQDAVERMRYTLERIPLPRSYGIHGYEAGHCTVAPGSDASEIVVTVDGVAQDTVYRAREQVTGAFGPLLTHELAHASDWQNAAGISPEVRLNLLHRVVRRLESGQAIPYAYVTNIRNPDRNLQRERLSKAKEYFAELMSDAFQASAETFQTTRDPARALATAFALRHGGRAERYLPDARIVVEYVHELDPGFHWEKAAHAREKTLNQLARERGRFLVERAISRLRSPVLVDELMQAFRRTYREALQETPVVLFGQAEEGDPKDDELLDDMVKERLGMGAVQRFAELRARLREDWQSDLDRVVRESRVELQGALSPWQDMAQMVGVPNDYADFADSGAHLDIASMVESLNQVLDGFRHEPELRRSFEERAQQLLALASGHIMLTTEDMAENASMRRRRCGGGLSYGKNVLAVRMVRDDTAVLQGDDAATEGIHDFTVMCHQDDRRAKRVDLDQQVHDVLCVQRVQVSGRLVS